MAMVKGLLGLMLLVAVVGCSSDDSEDGVHNQVNLCATKGATYLTHMVERAGGTCGPVADQIVNIDDPAITAGICSSVTQENCVERGTDCRTSVNGCELAETYMTTFEADGSSATSIETIRLTCPDGSSCVSTYDATMTRQ